VGTEYRESRTEHCLCPVSGVLVDFGGENLAAIGLKHALRLL
jgi:hypothetical protein